MSKDFLDSRSWFLRACRVMAWGGCVLFTVLFVQAVSGLLWKQVLPLKISVVDEGNPVVVARALLPKAIRDHRFLENAEVLENGRALRHRVKSVSRVGEGSNRFRIRGKFIYFSTSDGTDARLNNRSYEVRLGKFVKTRTLAITFAVVVALFFVSRKARLVAEWKVWRHWQLAAPWAAAMGAVVLGVFLLSTQSNFCDGSYMANDLPFSDASGWSELAVSLKDGRGFTGDFQANRPGYAVFLSAIYGIFGSHQVVGKASNVLLLAIASGFAWLLGKRYFGALGGVGLVVVLLSLADVHEMLFLTMTENLAMVLLIPAVYYLLWGWESGKLWALFLGSLLFSCSSLTRPFLLPAIAWMCLIPFFVSGIVRRGWWTKKAIYQAAVLASGFVLVFGPWCLRQKIVYDIWSPSFGSGVMLYAAAAEGIGHTDTYNAAHEHEADAAGIPKDDYGARSKYFSSRFLETVRADPENYVRRISRFFGNFFLEFSPKDEWTLAALALLVCLTVFAHAGSGAGLGWFLALPGFGYLFFSLEKLHFGLVLLSIVLLGLGMSRQRMVVLYFALFVLTAAAFNALVGNFAIARGGMVIRWLMVGLVLLPLWFRSGSKDEKGDAAAHRAFALPVLGLFFALLLVGWSAVIGRSMAYEPPSEVPPERVEVLKSWANSERKDEPRGDDFIGIRVKIEGNFGHFSAHEDGGHWAPLFRPMGFARAIFYPRALEGPLQGRLLAPCVARAEMGTITDGEYFLVGRLRSLPSEDPATKVIEVFALVPPDSEGAPDFENAMRFPRWEDGEKSDGAGGR